MTKTKITVSGEIELDYDKSSKEFKEAFVSFTECMNRNATINDMLLHVAFHVTRFGTDQMVEGVGYVGYNGRKPTESPYSGIMIGEDFDEFEFDAK